MKTLLIGLIFMASTLTFAEVKIGDSAPAFSEVDQSGKTQTVHS